MKLIQYIKLAIGTAASLALSIACAGPDPQPITAEQAFDAVMTGIDPVTGVKHGIGNIVIVDVRTAAEYQFQGTAGKVESIQLKGMEEPVVPDMGKARLSVDGKSLEYLLDGIKRSVQFDRITKIVTSAIAVNIPCASYNQGTKQMDPAQDAFRKGIEELAEKEVKVVITMCNSGGRSTVCIAKFIPDQLASKFKAFYEIDRAGEEYVHPKHGLHLAGLGGFQGSAYNGIYNGYAGYPGRSVSSQAVQGWKDGKPSGPSVSWKESALPIYIPETSCNLPNIPRTP